MYDDEKRFLRSATVVFEEYRAIEGEEEARAADDRKDLKAAERRYGYPEYGGNGIDLTDTEKYNETVTRNVNSAAMGRQLVNPATISLYRQFGGRMYDEAGVYNDDTSNIYRRGLDGGENIHTGLGTMDRSKNNDQVFGETPLRSTQALQNEQTAEVDAQKDRAKVLPDKSRINNGGQAGNGLFFNAEKQYSFSDKDYETAVKSGDIADAQEMVDAAAEEAGYTIKAYHGTNALFNVFDEGLLGSKNFMASSAQKGFFAAKSKDTAANYTGLNSRGLCAKRQEMKMMKTTVTEVAVDFCF